MKIKFTILGLAALLATTAHATLINWNSGTLNLAVPDANPVGIANSSSAVTTDNNLITAVDVRLNISGGYNGDLYGYLVLQSSGGTATAILLNRVGTTINNPFGSAASGFTSITLSDAGTLGNIHNPTTTPTSGSPVPTGSYTPDGASLNSTFSGLTANGTWTLFLADLAGGGGQSQLMSWGLDVTVVPEPATWALIIFALGIMALGVARRVRRGIVGTSAH